jgi:hypothetical protein
MNLQMTESAHYALMRFASVRYHTEVHGISQKCFPTDHPALSGPIAFLDRLCAAMQRRAQGARYVDVIAA